MRSRYKKVAIITAAAIAAILAISAIAMLIMREGSANDAQTTEQASAQDATGYASSTGESSSGSAYAQLQGSSEEAIGEEVASTSDDEEAARYYQGISFKHAQGSYQDDGDGVSFYVTGIVMNDTRDDISADSLPDATFNGEIASKEIEIPQGTIGTGMQGRYVYTVKLPSVPDEMTVRIGESEQTRKRNEADSTSYIEIANGTNMGSVAGAFAESLMSFHVEAISPGISDGGQPQGRPDTTPTLSRDENGTICADVRVSVPTDSYALEPGEYPVIFLNDGGYAVATGTLFLENGLHQGESASQRVYPDYVYEGHDVSEATSCALQFI